MIKYFKRNISGWIIVRHDFQMHELNSKANESQATFDKRTETIEKGLNYSDSDSDSISMLSSRSFSKFSQA